MTDKKSFLKKYKEQYLNIGITQSGQSHDVIEVPWARTCHVFNMKTPDIYLTPAELADPCFRRELDRFHILGCYIFDPLEDYSFIASFPELWDLYILGGHNITDLSFMEGLKEWFIFYLEDAKLKTLDPLFPKGQKRVGIFPYCIGFGNCRIEDISALEQEGLYLSELALYCPKGTNEKARWEGVRAGTFTYEEYDQKGETV